MENNDIECCLNQIGLYNHKGQVNKIILLKDERIVSCSSDESICLFSNNLEFKFSLRGHTSAVCAIAQIENGLIVSGSVDGTIKIWSVDKENYKCEHTNMNAHFDMIKDIIVLTNNRYLTYSYDQSIKLWKGENPYSMIRTIKGITSAIQCICYISSKDYLYVFQEEGNLKIINMNTYKKETMISNIDSNGSILDIQNNTLLIGGANTITLFDYLHIKVIKIIQCNFYTKISSFLFYDNQTIFFSSKNDRTYDIVSLNLLTEKFTSLVQGAHIDTITGLLITKEKKIVSSSKDHSIKRWEIIKK